MKSDKTKKKVWHFVFSGCLIVFGFLGRIFASVYLISYEDKWTPQDGPRWTMESMDKREWVVYILGAYVTPLMILFGLLVGIWLMWQFYREHHLNKKGLP